MYGLILTYYGLMLTYHGLIPAYCGLILNYCGLILKYCGLILTTDLKTKTMTILRFQWDRNFYMRGFPEQEIVQERAFP